MKTPVLLEHAPQLKEQFLRDAAERKANWLEAIHTLFAQIEHWAKDRPEWTTTRSTTDMDEEALGGKYTADVLEIAVSQDRLILEPIARAVLGANGRVDFYAWPSLFRVMLLRNKKTNEWYVRTDSGINWPQPWNQETFFDLAQRLLRDE